MNALEKVTRLFNSNITSYRIAKDCGLTAQYVDNYRSGRSKITNMKLGKAIMLAEYYDEKFKEEQTTAEE